MSLSLRPSAMLRVIGFSSETSLPASNAAKAIGHVPMVGRGDHHGVDVLAGQHVVEVDIRVAALVDARGAFLP